MIIILSIFAMALKNKASQIFYQYLSLQPISAYIRVTILLKVNMSTYNIFAHMNSKIFKMLHVSDIV